MQTYFKSVEMYFALITNIKCLDMLCFTVFCYIIQSALVFCIMICFMYKS